MHRAYGKGAKHRTSFTADGTKKDHTTIAKGAKWIADTAKISRYRPAKCAQ